MNGKGPYTFIFDTGGLNVVTPRLAAALSIKSEGKLKAAAPAPARWISGSEIGALEVGAAGMKDQLFVVARSMRWRRSRAWTFRHGRLRSVPTLRDPLDYGARTITLIAPDRFEREELGRSHSV